jgi:hypothetical protein
MKLTKRIVDRLESDGNDCLLPAYPRSALVSGAEAYDPQAVDFIGAGERT